MHFMTVDCDTFSNDEMAAVVQITYAEVVVSGSKAMFASIFSTLLSKCLMED